MTRLPSAEQHAQPSYLYDPAWQHELERLKALEDLFDPASRHFIQRLGIAQGWRCLEVGAGAGGLVSWLADTVGPSGRVVATDLEPRFVARVVRDNVEVRRHDLLRDPPIEGAPSFDLVHARAVLEHFAEPMQGVVRLVSAVRAGGWLMVEDVDLGSPLMAAAAGRYVWPMDRRALYRRIIDAIHGVFSRRQVSPSFGASLPKALEDVGLGDVGAEVHAPIVSGGQARDCIRLTLEYLRTPLLATGLVDEEDIAHFVDTTYEEVFRYVPMFMVSAWGRRPDATS